MVGVQKVPSPLVGDPKRGRRPPRSRKKSHRKEDAVHRFERFAGVRGRFMLRWSPQKLAKRAALSVWRNKNPLLGCGSEVPLPPKCRSMGHPAKITNIQDAAYIGEKLSKTGLFLEMDILSSIFS
jgi:hypothetical protein